MSTVDSQDLRGILIRLQDRLSNDDRHRLHFFLGDDIPRRIRDDPTLSGTLSLMESLFDQDKINAQDFTILINAFDAIQCRDAANILREYRNGLRGCDLAGSIQSLGSIFPNLYEADPAETEDPFPLLTVMVDKGTMCSPPSKPFFLFDLRHRVSRVTLMIFLFLVGLLFLSLLVSYFQSKKFDQLTVDCDEREKKLGEERQRTSEVERNWTNFKASSEAKIAELRQEAKEKKEEQRPLIKFGEKFGHFAGEPFDDSETAHFTHEHFFSGLTTRNVTDHLESYEFRYTTDLQSKPIRSRFHSTEMTQMRWNFDFNPSDRVNKVEGLLTEENIRLPNGTNSSLVVVTGLRFYSIKGKISSQFQGVGGTKFSENFTGYSLGYIRGRADPRDYLYQIQFVWYRTG